jgi:hypothetical protein
MTLPVSAQLLSRGLSAGATSALGFSTNRMSRLEELPTRHLQLALSPNSPRTAACPCWALLLTEDLGECFAHSPFPVP